MSNISYFGANLELTQKGGPQKIIYTVSRFFCSSKITSHFSKQLVQNLQAKSMLSYLEQCFLFLVWFFHIFLSKKTPTK